MPTESGDWIGRKQHLFATKMLQTSQKSVESDGVETVEGGRR
jgi:hypothetical protein